MTLGTFNGILVFHLAWIYQTAKSLTNSTRIHFGPNFQGVLDTALVHRNAHILGTSQ